MDSEHGTTVVNPLSKFLSTRTQKTNDTSDAVTGVIELPDI